MAWLASAPRADGPLRARGRLSHGDRVGITVLVSAAVISYVPLSLVGHPLMPGDDLTQNYPLRVLTGSLIRDGHFPTWDPFVWSGTPLLAGWNAGSLYPGTWLFALLPGVAAWTLNLVLLSAIAGLGVYVLLRILRCGPLGATLAALCFTYTGFISGQLAHIGLVQGAAYLAWMLVAVELGARASTIRAATLSVILLAASVALCVLAGEPRAISSAAVVVGVYLAGRLLGLGWRLGSRLAVVTATGVALGMGVGAAQWLPGLAFVARSQRTLDAYQAFGAGSFTWSGLGQSLLVPFLLGGNTNFGLPIYVGGYNLAEVTVGVGILPLVAACAYLPRLGANGLATLSHLGSDWASARARVDDRSHPPRRALAVWYVMGLVGVLLALGTSTPIGRLLVQIPLYGGQRLQNRNAVIFDLALAELLGFFVDDLVGPPRDADHRAPQPLALLETVPRRLLAALPVVGCVGLVVVAYLNPIGLQLRLGVTVPVDDLFKRLTPYLGVTVALALAIGCFSFIAHRLTHASRVVLVVVLAGADLGVYLANASYATAPSAVLAGSTAMSRQLAQLSEGGRFALYDPLDIGATEGQSSSELGKPDTNVLRGISSIQGYGSIVSGLYQNETNTHSLGDLNPAVLRNGLANELDLRVFLTLPVYLQEGLPPNSPIPVAGVAPSASSGASDPAVATPAPAPLASGPWVVAPSSSDQWLLASASTIRRVTIVVNRAAGQMPRVIDIALERPGQAAHFTAVPVVDGRAAFVPPTPGSAEAVVVRGPGSGAVTVGAVVVVTQNPDDRFLLDGSLQGSLAIPLWDYDGHLGPYTVFINHHVDGPAWLQSASSRTLTGAQPGLGSVVTTSESTSGEAKMSVVAKRPSLLVRSVAFEPGSTAQLTPKGRSARRLAVRRLGLIQAVEIPAGNYQVTWSYAPQSVVLGILFSLASLIVAMVVVALLIADRRRRRRTGVSAITVPGP
jgi:hypothetical protein